ncbi:hypothetical protein [Candidatus Solirubrobacter pratensis]|uniref:hypothetical protein n=1 Tax=Candidatus Solirubrobacter pratensis TaxID=1298857 RepID=UPI000484E8AB|nr:hypothetical protein [Candidatus Solirubrobacter pratensis]
MSSVGRRAIAGVVVATAVASGAVIARADDSPASAAKAVTGGLGVNPMVIEKPAAAGAVGTLTVSNNSSKKLAVNVTARPWMQSSSGAVSINRAKTLSGIRVSEPSFALAAGQKKAVSVTALSGAATYGGIEITGLPDGASKQTGAVLGYRLVTSLRLNPASPVLSLKAGTPKVSGKGSKRAIVMPLRNAGNTIQPVTGSVRLKSALGTRQRALASIRILPGKSVDVLLSAVGSVKAGSYTATVQLKQGGKTTTVTKKLTIKR